MALRAQTKKTRDGGDHDINKKGSVPPFLWSAVTKNYNKKKNSKQVARDRLHYSARRSGVARRIKEKQNSEESRRTK